MTEALRFTNLFPCSVTLAVVAYTKVIMKTLRDIGELKAIARIVRRLPGRVDVVVGAGDDCAVVRSRSDRTQDLLLKSDPVIEGIHFKRDVSPAAIGHKVMGRVLSDIAAMGGEPCWALLDLVGPPGTSVKTLDGIYDGAAKLAETCGLAIVGGDLSQGPVLEIHAFAVGRIPRGQAVLRSGAKLGDVIFVTGTLGGSLQAKHLAFEPHLREGQFLRRWATAMIDVSDGMASDLRHIIERSRVGARIEAMQIPVSLPAWKMKGARTPLEHALFDGEDFELLFTIPARKVGDFLGAWRKAFDLPCTPIGYITGRKGVIEMMDANGKNTTLTQRGFQHFRGPADERRETK